MTISWNSFLHCLTSRHWTTVDANRLRCEIKKLTLKKSHTTSQFFFFAEFIQPLGIIKKPNNESKTHQRHARLDKSDLQDLHISRSITYINKFNNPACSPSPKSSQTIQNFITKQFSHSWLLEYQHSDFTSQATLDSTTPNSNFSPHIYIICLQG